MLPRDEVPLEYFIHENTGVPTEVKRLLPLCKNIPFFRLGRVGYNAISYIKKQDISPCIMSSARTSLQSFQQKILMSYPDGQVRLITPLELQRFMGIPEDFPWPPDLAPGYKMRQIGNSICVPILNSLVHRVVAALDTVNKI